MEEDRSWKARILVIGTVVGAVTGLGVALVLVQRAEQQGEAVKLNTSEGLRLGMGLFALLRQIGQIGVK